MAEVPTITRTHLTSLLVTDGVGCLVLTDEGLRAVAAKDVINAGRLVCVPEELLEAGIRTSAGKSRLAAGSGPIADRAGRAGTRRHAGEDPLPSPGPRRMHPDAGGDQADWDRLDEARRLLDLTNGGG